MDYNKLRKFFYFMPSTPRHLYLGAYSNNRESERRAYQVLTTEAPTKIRTQIVMLMPDSHFYDLHPDRIKAILELIKQEQNADVRRHYLSILDHRLFNDGWGWFWRGGRGLSTLTREIKDIPATEKADALQVLRTVKAFYRDLNFKPKYGTTAIINDYIRAYGGRVMSHEEKKTQAKARLTHAKAALEAGAKMPRKMKKAIQKTY